ncbi:Protein draper, partial [Gryllus bimaculatus]
VVEKLDIPSINTEKCCDQVIVFDGVSKEIARVRGEGKSLNVVSTGNIMTVMFVSDYSNVKTGFRATYLAESIPDLSVPELQSESGVITSSLNISQPSLCMSLIYSLPSSGSLNIYADQSTAGKIYFRQTHTNLINGWRISRYVSNSTLDIRDDSTKLSIHLEGRKSKIFSIAECSTDGDDVYVFPGRYWEGYLPKNLTSKTRLRVSGETVSNCNHGGAYDKIAKTCVCPTGFAGPTCTEACGPNHFGLNCSGTCSSFQDGCKNIIFCNITHNCSCAAGFTGNKCEKECEPGTYGANCQNLCGKCKEGSCNKYTGECDDLCEEGYYPPLCQHQYAFLSQAPSIKERSFNSVVISANFQNPKGMGIPHLYEVQFKKIGSSEWNKTSVQEINSRSVVLITVTDLNVGTKYLLRIVVICEDGNSYRGDSVPTLQFETDCQVPNSNIYEMESRNITQSSFIITWNYPVYSDKWCPVDSFQIILQDQWKTYSQELPIIPFGVTTEGKVPGKVRHLTVNSRNGRNIQISWKRPLFTGSIKGYRIQYQCVKRFICEESCGNSSGSLETKEHSANLYNLLPHVQYKIRVAAYSSSQGPFTSVFATTKTTSPDVSPIASNQPIVSKSNTTVIVQWLPPPCPGRNGQLTGYHFSLTSETEKGTTILQNGTTKDLQTSFTSLTPMTQYQVFVYAMTSHGWNTDFKLVIPFSSSATVPDTVQNLEVYKRGRRMIGIRWAKPKRVYGTLESFTVAHHQKGSEDTFSHTMSPNACSGWPHLYCYTINKYLQPDKQYIVSVTARNHEIDEDGMASEINAVTRENAPDAPASLTIRRSTSTSFEMEWELPNLFNGELRSFLVNIEHIDSFNETECCEYFPVQELPVREESPIYNLEVTGLNPASTYIVSVSAKTITMGPSINATYHTSPLAPTDLKSPEVIGMAEDGHSYVLKIKPIHMISSTNSTYLLLVLPPGELSPPVIWERELLGKLIQAVNASFYIVSEFTSVELVSAQETEIGTGRTVTNGTLGQLMDPKLTPGYYRVGLALVQRYGHAISVDLATSNRFEFRAVDLERVVS